MCESLPPANVVCEGYIFTGVCDSVNGGVACVVARGGVHDSSWGWGMCGFCQGVCVVFPGGRAWFLPGGACVFFPRGVCVVFPGGHT